MAERMRNNAMYAIPDDGEQSTYRFIIVAAKRARQLQNGARPFLPTTSKKFCPFKSSRNCLVMVKVRPANVTSAVPFSTMSDRLAAKALAT